MHEIKDRAYKAIEEAQKKRQELEVDPESLRGYVFRIPSIVGLGTGNEFDVANIHLPVGWQKAIPELQKLDTDELQTTFYRICNKYKVTPGVVNFDSKSGILKEVSTQGEIPSFLSLFESPYHTQVTSWGEYISYNLRDLATAVALQEFVVGQYLTRIAEALDQKMDYGFIDGRGSENLKVPDSTWQSEDPALNKYQVEDVTANAHNIAGRFGQNIEQIRFNERGILTYVLLSPEASYYLLPDSKEPNVYDLHNVATIEQAAALHGIVSLFLNEVIKEQEEFNPDLWPNYNLNI